MSEQEPDKTPGIFSWNELMTDDIQGATEFYGKLFGWTVKAQDMGGGFIYHMFQLGERPVAGMMEIHSDMGPVSPCWNSYVNTEDVDASCAAALEAGGTIIMPVKEIDNVGKLAGFVDRSGAAIFVWQNL